MNLNRLLLLFHICKASRTSCMQWDNLKLSHNLFALTEPWMVWFGEMIFFYAKTTVEKTKKKWSRERTRIDVKLCINLNWIEHTITHTNTHQIINPEYVCSSRISFHFPIFHKNYCSSLTTRYSFRLFLVNLFFSISTSNIVSYPFVFPFSSDSLRFAFFFLLSVFVFELIFICALLCKHINIATHSIHCGTVVAPV